MTTYVTKDELAEALTALRSDLAEIRKEMVTKSDFNHGLSVLEKEVRQEIASLREHLEGKIADVHADVKWLREESP